jgi:hypothetical protein
MEYTELTDSEQRQILQQRLKQYEAEHYNQTINFDLLKDKKDEQSVVVLEQIKDTLKELDIAHAEITNRLAL